MDSAKLAVFQLYVLYNLYSMDSHREEIHLHKKLSATEGTDSSVDVK